MRHAILLALFALGGPAWAGTGVHTTYLWHMHQPIYWPDESTWTPGCCAQPHLTICRTLDERAV
jgi:hypothetical protein